MHAGSVVFDFIMRSYPILQITSFGNISAFVCLGCESELSPRIFFWETMGMIFRILSSFSAGAIFKQVTLEDLGILQLAAHELFVVSRKSA